MWVQWVRQGVVWLALAVGWVPVGSASPGCGCAARSDSYNQLRCRVEQGESVLVYAGVAPRPLIPGVYVRAMPGEPPGLYHAYRDPNTGKPMIRELWVRQEPAAVHTVTIPSAPPHVWVRPTAPIAPIRIPPPC